MATLISPPEAWLITEWEDNCGYASAVFSGAKPDGAHLEQGGYHCSIEDLLRYGNGGDYSNTRPDDKGFNPKYGAAIDMSMSPSDMKLCYQRMWAVWNDRSDPRRRFINAFNCYKGTGDASRLDMVANTIKVASPDHKWHNHKETRRRYLLDWQAARAIASALKGQSKADYIKEQSMTLSQTELNKLTATEYRLFNFLQMNAEFDNMVHDELEKAPMVTFIKLIGAGVDEIKKALEDGATIPGISIAVLSEMLDRKFAALQQTLHDDIRAIVRAELDGTVLAKRV